MKRDMQIIRQLLKAMETGGSPAERMPAEVRAYHERLIVEHGLCQSGELTWKGHDLLEELERSANKPKSGVVYP